jgi:hypothetical protein
VAGLDGVATSDVAGGPGQPRGDAWRVVVHHEPQLSTLANQQHADPTPRRKVKQIGSQPTTTHQDRRRERRGAADGGVQGDRGQRSAGDGRAAVGVGGRRTAADGGGRFAAKGVTGHTGGL